MNGRRRRKVEKWDRAQHELSNDFLLKKDSSEIETLEEVNIDVISDGATDLSQIFVVEDTRQRLIVVTNISSLNEFFLSIWITVLCTNTATALQRLYVWIKLPQMGGEVDFKNLKQKSGVLTEPHLAN